MKRFVFTKLFLLLQEASKKGAHVDAKAWENSYDEFVMSLFENSVSFRNKATCRRALVYTLVELTSLTGVLGKNAGIYLHKAIKFVEKQIEWMEKKILSEQTERHFWTD
ncbi:MAG: hypothetical protein LBI60_05250 [Bacteroidales bacterium]|jgi:hypothetical protein|nr:hypothetical protein [Bacteroidales bacterium]